MSDTSPPAGYRESALGGTMLVARDAHHDALRDVLTKATLHGWAAGQPGARAMQGRVVAWATQLADGAKVVVRHSHHGGLLAPLTGDLFLKPPRAAHELAMAVALRAAGVATPDVIGYAIYDAVGPLCRADVVTQFVDGADFPAAWAAAQSPAAREAIVDAVVALLQAMRAAHVHHPDLNVKNVLLAGADGRPAAWLLDVDRASIPDSSMIAESAAVTGRQDSLPEMFAQANVRRFTLSIEKWRQGHGLDFSREYLGRLLDGVGVERPWRQDSAES